MPLTPKKTNFQVRDFLTDPITTDFTPTVSPPPAKKPEKRQNISEALAYLDSAMINLKARKMNGKVALLEMLQKCKDLLSS